MIDKHGGAILADLLDVYGVDLRDLFSDEDPLSPRYVLNLIVQLPTTGAFYASRRGGVQFRGWDDGRYVAKAMVDSQRATNYILAMVNRDPSRPKPKAPDPFPTPDDETHVEPPKQGSFAAMVVAAKKAARLRKERENAQ